MASQTRNPSKSVLDSSKEQPSDPSVDDKQQTGTSNQAETNDGPNDRSSSNPAEETLELPKVFDLPSTTSETLNPFFWPEAGRGQVVLSQENYKIMMDGLLDHFYDEEEIVASTKAYTDQVASLADQLTWGQKVIGTNTGENNDANQLSTTNSLDVGLIRKRKQQDDNAEASTAASSEAEKSNGHEHSISTPSQSAPVTMLNSSLVRKKKKI